MPETAQGENSLDAIIHTVNDPDRFYGRLLQLMRDAVSEGHTELLRAGKVLEGGETLANVPPGQPAEFYRGAFAAMNMIGNALELIDDREMVMRIADRCTFEFARAFLRLQGEDVESPYTPPERAAA